MKVSILEVGDYSDEPDIRRVFTSVEAAISHVPGGFVQMESWNEWLYFQDDVAERYATIRTYEVEDE